MHAGLLKSRDELWMCAGYTYLQHIGKDQLSQKEKHSFEEIVSKEYRGHAKVFFE